MRGVRLGIGGSQPPAKLGGKYLNNGAVLVDNFLVHLESSLPACIEMINMHLNCAAECRTVLMGEEKSVGEKKSIFLVKSWWLCESIFNVWRAHLSKQ